MKTLKVNGENAQIAFNAKVDSWIVCSKNVAMFVRTRDDIDLYKDQMRFNFSSMIAQVWFDHLDTLSPETLLDLKKDLNGLTLIGEYVGNDEY